MSGTRLPALLAVAVLAAFAAPATADEVYDAAEAGRRLSGEGRYEEAIPYFDRAAGLYRAADKRPNLASVLNNRATAYRGLRRYREALTDYDEAIRLDPARTLYRLNRGVIHYLAGRYDSAIGEYADACRTAPTGEVVTYARILTYFAHRRLGRGADAARVLAEAAARADTAAWPYPVIRFLRREIAEQAALVAASDTDQMAEIRCYIGLDLSIAGQPEEALAHLRWVKENARSRTLAEYSLAVEEIRRIRLADE